jgi:glycosyltransferase involved in cell wall biosynthesis
MKIHVLLCSHNGEAFVADQLASIVSQTHAVDIVHVHDYASHDRTREIVQSHVASTGTCMVQLHAHQNAPGAALSFLEAMTALAPCVADEDLVLLCDQDDVWLADKVERIVRVLLASKQDAVSPVSVLICHDVKLVDRQLTEISPTFYTGHPFALPRDLALDRVLLANPVIGHTMALSGPLLRSVVALSRPQCYLMHDWAITLTASRVRAGAIHYLPETLSLYRQHGANIIGASGRRSFIENIKWVFGFSDKVVRQARTFFSDERVISGADFYVGGRLDRIMCLAAKKAPASIYFIFFALAFFRGPTLKRRLLGFAFLAGGFGALLGRSRGFESEEQKRK